MTPMFIVNLDLCQATAEVSPFQDRMTRMECRCAAWKIQRRWLGSSAQGLTTKAVAGPGNSPMSALGSAMWGLVYKLTELTTDARHACCAAQMFLTNGEGVVFRGALGNSESALVRIQKGECDLDTVLSDILGLTKINFNSCLFRDRLPVTIKFANDVGDVLIAVPMDSEPRLPFKFYI